MWLGLGHAILGQQRGGASILPKPRGGHVPKPGGRRDQEIAGGIQHRRKWVLSGLLGFAIDPKVVSKA